mgnify:CR=1 FL=1
MGVLSSSGTVLRLPTHDIATQYMALGFSRDEAIILWNKGVTIEEAKRYADLNTKYNVKFEGYEIVRLNEEAVPFFAVEAVTKKSNADEGLPR